MIAPGMFMVLAVGFMVRLAMFMPRVDMLAKWSRSWFEEEHRVQDVGEATIHGKWTYVVVYGTT